MELQLSETGLMSQQGIEMHKSPLQSDFFHRVINLCPIALK